MAADAAIGSALRAARERIGLGLAQVAQQLNLDPDVVRALEDERFDALGAPVFVRGHLRRYADLLGEPADLLQQRYDAVTRGGGDPDLTQVPRVAPPPDPRRYRLPAVILAAALVLAGIVWWALHAPPAR